MPDWMKNPILLSVANKIAYTFAGWLIHKGLVAGDQQSQVEGIVEGAILGLISLGWTIYQSYLHNQQNKVVAQLVISHPLSVIAAQNVVNGKTPNGV